MGKTNPIFYCFILSLMLCLFSPALLSAHTVNVSLSWDAIQDPELAGYTVVWGLVSKNYTGAQNLGTVTEATIQLESGRTYFLAVRGFDVQGVAGELSQEMRQFIKAPSDSTPDPNGPIKFTQITLSNVGNTSVTINWTTDIVTTGAVYYGIDSTGQFNSPDSAKSTDHQTVVSGLVPSTVYEYRIMASDGGTKQANPAVLSFKSSDRLSQPARPSPNASFIPSIVENTQLRTNLGINNLSSTIANVNVTLVDKEGIVLATKTVQVDPKGFKQINGAARFLYEDHL